MKPLVLERNADLFFAIADRVEFDPDSYNQHTWGRPSSWTDCGTICCIAGHALSLSGYEVSMKNSYTPRFTKRGQKRGIASGDAIARRAANLLGLSSTEARLLFDGGWEPKSKYTVAEALRRIGKGESIERVTRL